MKRLYCSRIENYLQLRKYNFDTFNKIHFELKKKNLMSDEMYGKIINLYSLKTKNEKLHNMAFNLCDERLNNKNLNLSMTTAIAIIHHCRSHYKYFNRGIQIWNKLRKVYTNHSIFKDVNTWNILIKMYGGINDIDKAKETYHIMIINVKPNPQTFILLLNAYGYSRIFSSNKKHKTDQQISKEAFEIFTEARKCFKNSNLEIFNQYMNVCASIGDIESCKRLLEKMETQTYHQFPLPNAQTYISFIRCFNYIKGSLYFSCL